MIPIKNVYYLLSYAFVALRQGPYRKLATEEFANAADLCAAILVTGVSSQLKRGLARDYVTQTQATRVPSGKIEITASLKEQGIRQDQVVCTSDEFLVDIHLNRILKATLSVLLRAQVTQRRKKEIARLLGFFTDVTLVRLDEVDWQVRYHRHNQSYQLLVSVCWLVAKGLLMGSEKGELRLAEFFDEQQLSRLYERFLLGYFQREHPELRPRASYIDWDVDDDFTELLPAMKSDVTLTGSNQVLIIDAKFYQSTTQQHFAKHTLHSANLYQIYTYVKNKEAGVSRQNTQDKVAGLLLYARTDAQVQPDGWYQLSGTEIGVQTLDLNQDFVQIKAQLEQIITRFFSPAS